MKKTAAALNEPKGKLREIMIDSVYFTERSARTGRLNKKQLDSLHVPRMFPGKEWADDFYTYQMLDTITGKGYAPFYILSRFTETEQWAWITQYEENGNPVFSEPVFYQDFVEYFSSTSARLGGDELIIFTKTDYGEGLTLDTIRYRLHKNGHFKPLP